MKKIKPCPFCGATFTGSWTDEYGEGHNLLELWSNGAAGSHKREGDTALEQAS